VLVFAHVVALAEAWTSGASSWTTARRQQFANSLGDGQLIAVTDNVNSSKSDRDAAEWQPPRVEYHCMFAKHVVHVKYSWGLSMDTAEKNAINDMLATCDGEHVNGQQLTAEEASSPATAGRWDGWTLA
jgi:Protein of unknown function (DUF1524)